MSRRRAVSSALAMCAALVLSACATSAGSNAAGGGGGGSGSAGGRVITAAASINAWGSILSQLGGTHVKTTSIINNPDTDPHAYEPTPADAKLIATASLFVENGIGYDSWAAKAIAADPNPNRIVIDVGHVTGTPHDGNPHRWYSPTDVEKVADAITAALKKADPGNASYYDSQRQRYENIGLAEYHRLIDAIKKRYAGTPVGASESIFTPLAEALGLDVVTPPGFLKTISEGSDPSAADKATIDAQLADRKLKVYVFNSQNSTPDVAAQVDAARKQRIPVSTITETLFPAGANFQDWQSAQLQRLADALAEATGR